MAQNSHTMNVSVSSFILTGIPGLEEYHIWIALPWSATYIITVLANLTVLVIVKMESSLHQPMYLFLSMLLNTDLVMTNAFLPKMLVLFWFNMREISFEGCLIQLFLVHAFAIMGTGVLLAMAFDRYTAICHPLRYTVILTNQVITTVGLLVFLRGFLLGFPQPFLVQRLPFCRSKVIIQTYCEHMAVAKLACADISVNTLYGLFVALFVVGADSLFIAISYFMIVRAVLKLPSREARRKAFNTCSAHIALILLAYVPALFSATAQRFSTNIAPHFQILLSNMYLLLPSMFNPIVYGIKTKQIRVKILACLKPTAQF